MTEAALAREPVVPQRVRAKARTLVEALPYIREHAGKTVVVKIGGTSLADPELLDFLAQDVALLRLAGVHPVVVHGGGPQITAMSERLGLRPRFERGLRVTDEETLDVVRMVLVGRINADVVSAINRQGVSAAGVSGQDGAMLQAKPRVGLGLVGEIVDVRPSILETLLERFVPVVASMAADGRGQAYNVNADEAAAAVAVALGATKLVYLTDVPGLLEGSGGRPSILSEVSAADCERLLADGGVTGGMIPKVEALLDAIRRGVARGHILDGRVPHALILELFTPEGLGTMITSGEGS